MLQTNWMTLSISCNPPFTQLAYARADSLVMLTQHGRLTGFFLGPAEQNPGQKALALHHQTYILFGTWSSTLSATLMNHHKLWQAQ